MERDFTKAMTALSDNLWERVPPPPEEDRMHALFKFMSNEHVQWCVLTKKTDKGRQAVVWCSDFPDLAYVTRDIHQHYHQYMPMIMSDEENEFIGLVLRAMRDLYWEEREHDGIAKSLTLPEG